MELDLSKRIRGRSYMLENGPGRTKRRSISIWLVSL